MSYSTSSLFVQVRRLEHQASQITGQIAESSAHMEAETRSQLQEVHQTIARIEAAIFNEAGSFSRAQEQTECQIQDLQRDISMAIDDMTTRIDEVITAQQPVRRHMIRAGTALRELGLKDSLDGLATVHGNSPRNAVQESAANEPGSGGSMSSKA